MSQVPGFPQGRARFIFIFSPNLCHLSTEHSGNKPTIRKLFLVSRVWNCSSSLTWKYDVAMLEFSSQSAMYLFPKDPTCRLSQVSVSHHTPTGLPATGQRSKSLQILKALAEQSCWEAQAVCSHGPRSQVFRFQKQNKTNNKPSSSSSHCWVQAAQGTNTNSVQ